MLPGRNSLFALRRDCNAVFDRCVPLQIAIINYLADFQEPCGIWQLQFGFYCFTYFYLTTLDLPVRP